MEVTYTTVGDYLLPNLILNESPSEMTPPLGRYGMMHKAYLQEHRPILYNQLLLTGRLYPLCREVELSAMERRYRGVPEEIILRELVFD